MKNKFALITGAGGGIGKATALLLASKGCNLYLLDKDGKSLKRLYTKISKKYSVKVKIATCDVTNSSELKKIKTGKINFIVNVAGLSILQTKGILDETAFDKLLQVNLKSAYLTSMIYGYKSLKKGGAIVNVSSIRARTGTPSFSSGYAAAKAGLINLTKSLALELADKKIRVNAVAPGPTYPTKMSQNWSTKLKKQLTQNIPLKRLAKPKDIAGAIGFLLSKQAEYITGHTLDVNGGLWMN